MAYQVLEKKLPDLGMGGIPSPRRAKALVVTSI